MERPKERPSQTKESFNYYHFHKNYHKHKCFQVDVQWVDISRDQGTLIKLTDVCVCIDSLYLTL